MKNRSTDPNQWTTWKLHPPRTALLVIDVQNDYADRDGYFGGLLGKKIGKVRRILPPLRRLILACRRNGVRVIWTQSVRMPKDNERVKHRILPPNFAKTPWWLGGPAKGSWGAKIVEEIKPKVAEQVIQKSRNSAFFKTDLEGLLRGAGIDTLLFSGLATNICVESSLRDAYFRDFDLILVDDCCAASDASFHEATLRTVENAYSLVASSDEIISRLKMSL